MGNSKRDFREEKRAESAATDSTPMEQYCLTFNVTQNADDYNPDPSFALEWAKVYSGLDLVPIPIIPGTKIPSCEWKDFQERRPTEEELHKLFADDNSNIAIVAGELSGVLVVDLDSTEGTQKAQELGLFDTPTPTVKTARGKHLYFAYTEGVRNFQNKADLPGIDLRGDGGCAVAPGSTHETGHEYVWVPGKSPWDIPFAPFPEVLLTKGNSADLSIDDLKKGVEKGMRNNALARLVGHWAGKGSDRDECLRKAIKWNRKNQPPLSEDEVGTTVNSICDRHDDSISTRSSGRGTEIDQFRGADYSYFTDSLGEPHVRLNTGKCFEILPMNSEKMKLFIKGRIYQQSNTMISEQRLKNLLDILTCGALFDGPKHELFYRSAINNGTIWVDLGDDLNQAVRIDCDGFQIVESTDVPILFRRRSHMKSLPEPIVSNNLDDLKSLIRVANDDTWVLLQVWLVTAFIPNIPRPGIVFHGLHGSGKSMTGQLLRSLIDPSEIPLITLPKNESEFAQQLNNNYVIALDNVQSLKPWMSDCLCRAVTGVGFSKRKLYTDNDDIIFKYKRPFIINGISNPAEASDLLDRSILIELKRIPEKERDTESEIFEKFIKMQPAVFGAICNALSVTLKTAGDCSIPQLPRMADWARYGYASAEALGIGGDRFLEAYANNAMLQHLEVIDNNLVALAVKSLAEKHGDLQETPSDIYRMCKAELDDDEKKSSDWPKNVSVFSKQLRTVSNNLRELGVYVDFSRPAERQITINYKPK